MREYEQKVYADKIKLFDILIMAVLKAVYFPIFTYLLWTLFPPKAASFKEFFVSIIFIGMSLGVIKPIKNYIAYRKKFPM